MAYSNWSGSVKFTPNIILFPSSIKEVQSIVKNALENKQKIRVVGSAHSFTPLIETQDILVSLDHLQGIISHDNNTLEAEVFAGTKLHLLGILLHDLGMAQENMGDINVQSIAGALSTGTHGTGITLGTLATQLLEITLVNGLGELITLKKEDGFSFECAQISLGSLGVIVKVKLQLVEAYKLKYTVSKINFTDCIHSIDQLIAENRNVEFYYFPYTETCQLKVMNFSNEKIKSGGVFKKFNDYVMENALFWLLCKISLWFKAHKSISKISAWGVSTGSYSNDSYKLYATKRFVKFNEMEYNVPIEHFKEVITEIKNMIVREKISVNFPIECRFVKQDTIPLSPCYDRNSAYIAAHMFKPKNFVTYFKKVEEIVARYNGRPHWGKKHFLVANDFSKRYPKWEDFNRVRTEMDPHQVFMSSYLRSIFIADEK